MESPQLPARTKQSHPGSIFTSLKGYSLDYLFLFLIGGIIISLDQWTKALVRSNIPLGTDWLPGGLAWLLPYARIRHWYNSGAAFGIFQNGNLVFTILAIIVILLIFYYYPRTERTDWALRVAMAMQFAGAGGNLIDRLLFAHVTDYISVGNFAIFNIADASISVGVVVLLFGVWLKEQAEKKKARMAVLRQDDTHIQGEDEMKSG
jgi:signal peptidase II